MVTNKKSLGFGAVLFMAVSMGSVNAEEGDINQTRTQDRIRTEANQQTPESETAQAQIREQKMEQKMEQVKTQAENENESGNSFQTSQRPAVSGSMSRPNMMNRSGRGMH